MSDGLGIAVGVKEDVRNRDSKAEIRSYEGRGEVLCVTCAGEARYDRIE